jgi:hypothetical protein
VKCKRDSHVCSEVIKANQVEKEVDAPEDHAAFSVWTEFTVSTGKEVDAPEDHAAFSVWTEFTVSTGKEVDAAEVVSESRVTTINPNPKKQECKRIHEKSLTRTTAVGPLAAAHAWWQL